MRRLSFPLAIAAAAILGGAAFLGLLPWVLKPQEGAP
jgi:hypothetical protein